MTDEGYVKTPRPVTDWIVAKLFITPPSKEDKLLLPGCGTGQFLAAVERYCSYRGHPCPEIYAVETNPQRAEQFQDRFANSESPHQPSIPDDCATQLQCTYPLDWSPAHRDVAVDINLRQADFLLNPPAEKFEYIVANPPFVKYNAIKPEKREQYKQQFDTADGKFNLYAPFVEQMCTHLADNGELKCILPDGFLFGNNSALRQRLRKETIHGVRPLPEAVFPDHQVRTSLVEVSNDPSFSIDGSFALTQWLYRHDIESILSGVGVPEGELEAHIDSYDERRNSMERCLRVRRRRDKGGGYNTRVDPTIEHEEPAQHHLGDWL
jgi:type I restriction-modification system DNA methylase subunit